MTRSDCRSTRCRIGDFAWILLRIHASQQRHRRQPMPGLHRSQRLHRSARQNRLHLLYPAITISEFRSCLEFSPASFTLTRMKFSGNGQLSRSLLFAATFIAALARSSTANAQAEAVEQGAEKSVTVLPLEKSASRGIVTRDPSDIVKC